MVELAAMPPTPPPVLSPRVVRALLQLEAAKAIGEQALAADGGGPNGTDTTDARSREGSRRGRGGLIMRAARQPKGSLPALLGSFPGRAGPRPHANPKASSTASIDLTLTLTLILTVTRSNPTRTLT